MTGEGKTATQLMARRPLPLSVWRERYERWQRETNTLREQAVALVAGSVPDMTLSHKDGKLVLDVAYPPAVDAMLDGITQHIIQHAIDLGLDVPPVEDAP